MNKLFILFIVLLTTTYNYAIIVKIFVYINNFFTGHRQRQTREPQERVHDILHIPERLGRQEHIFAIQKCIN